MTGTFLAADLVNLALATPWTAEQAENTLRKHDIRWPELNRASSDALREWAQRVRHVFEVTDPEQRCLLINELLEEGSAGVHLTTHDGLRPHLHFTPDENDVVSRVKAVTAGGLAMFTVESEGQRLGVCLRAGCGTVFVDTSRNGRRAYCSTRCGNSDAVLRHRTSRRP
ncbi:CGNR zinc finger domain-containing protein [Kineosporia babensis]|uniref:CGNR zinc finger domain-containing protein n=2 Tax=Kineosporia babensis TaxID=499548 RepID=A0A9X1T042_9ACTN|nr:CGNR zinc finger domain-containing protein [Kineosporia babensis]MCD5312388.1 CGNR zinc finger domain-containing protein [Kineosporia babensis]